MKTREDSSKSTTKSATVIGTFEGKCGDASVENNNQMTLGPELWSNLFSSEDYQRGIELGHYIGFLGHPEDPGCQDYKDACIIMREGQLESDGSVTGKFDLIDTPVGRVVKAFIDAGVQFGLSIRGAGDVSGSGDVDPDTFVFRGFDLVTFPAYNDAVPTFTEIAASSDMDKQVKYKAVCAAIKNNLPSIDNVQTIDMLQSQFGKSSDAYKQLESRKLQITGSSDVDVKDAKLKGITQLYLDMVAANRALKDELAAVKATERAHRQTSVTAARELKVLKRIVAAQLKDATDDVAKLSAELETVTASNQTLKDRLQSVQDQNLKYRQKVNSNTAVIKDKDATISQLESQLRETVTAATNSKRDSSNLDGKVKQLESKIAASTKLVESYQEAYADLYASVLGVHLDAIKINASTSVSELKSLIQSGTSTANISTAFVEPCPVDLDEEYDEDDLVTV